MSRDLRFKFKQCSKFNEKSEFQEEMMEAIEETQDKKTGIVVAPCGAGKSAVIIEALLKAGTLGLILCYESQGVYQMREAIVENTTIDESYIYTFSGSTRDTLPDPNDARFCFLITTYGMVAESKARRNAESRRVGSFVRNTPWHLVCCDEFHHAGATTYKPLVKDLVKVAERVLGFTATLYRSDDSCKPEKLDFATEAKAFDKWFGPVIYRTTCKQLEDAGLIAKIRRSVVECDFTPEFRAAYDKANGYQKTYLAALHPTKLNVLKAICHFHKHRYGHIGIVFANHLIVAQIAKECLGSGWAVLSGGSAHGSLAEQQKNNPARNNKIVKRFNEGQLDGMICTAVGESSMDAYLDRFCFVVVLEADGGIASAGQRIGRVARNTRINQAEGQLLTEVRKERLKHQKIAGYYDLVTLKTTDQDAFDERQNLFKIEGYETFEKMTPDEAVESAFGVGLEPDQLPYTSLRDDLPLLKRVLMYVKMHQLCAEASAAAAENNAEARKQLEMCKQRAASAAHPLFRDQARKTLPSKREHLKRKKMESKEIEHDKILNLPMDENTRTIFEALDVPIAALASAGLFSDLFCPSPDADDDE